MEVTIGHGWKTMLQEEFSKPYFHQLVQFVKSEYRNHQVYPPGNLIFNAFETCPLEKVKVVIIGQDPYHGSGQANGLSFSVNPGIRVPPSLQNIYKELHQDIGKPIPDHGDLSSWAKQGVLLLNATLTVRSSTPGSHQRKGWENFTDAVIQQLAMHQKHLVFILWGAYAQKKGANIDHHKHLVIESAHPSPFAAYRGFFGSKPFSRCNEYLKSHGIEPIHW